MANNEIFRGEREITVNPDFKNPITNAMAILATRSERKCAMPGLLNKTDGVASFVAALLLAVPAAPVLGFQSLFSVIKNPK